MKLDMQKKYKTIYNKLKRKKLYKASVKLIKQIINKEKPWL